MLEISLAIWDSEFYFYKYKDILFPYISWLDPSFFSGLDGKYLFFKRLK